MDSLEEMIKNLSQYSLADLNLRFSMPCLWNLDFKEEGLMNVFADCLKDHNLEQRNSSVREKKQSHLYFGSSQTHFKANRLNSLGSVNNRHEG